MGKYITMTVKSQSTDGELTQGFNAKARCTLERERETQDGLDLGEFLSPFIILLIKHIVCFPLIGSQ